MCAKVTQYSRISHHTIAGSASAGSTFSVPPQEDFTDGSWTPFDLALSEIGVNEEDKRVYIRIGDTIEELGVIGGSALGTTPSLFQVLQVGFNTDGEPIQFRDVLQNNIGRISNGLDDQLQISGGNYIEFEGGSNARMILDGLTSSIRLSDGVDYITEIIFTTQSTIINTEDLLTPKQGKLEVDRNFTYFAHFDGSSGSLSYIQAQDDTIDIQTQAGGVLNKINLDSSIETIEITSLASGGEFSSIDIVSTATPSIILRTEDALGQFASIDLSAVGTILNTPLITLLCDDGSNSSQAKVDIDKVTIGNGVADMTVGFVSSVTQQTGSFIIHKKNSAEKYYDFGENGTTNATPIAIGTIDFSIGGLNDRVITVEANVSGVSLIVNLAYGAKLFAVFKSIGGVITQLSTTDKSEKTDFTTASSDIVISGTDIIIEVTGEAATNINWETDFSYRIN